jgi:transcriptional regulator with XRE-family HTH domain
MSTHVVNQGEEESPEQLFGRAVRQAREERGWSQETLAAELASLGINVGGQSGIARIERGIRPTRLNEVVQIVNALVIDPEDIYGYAADRLDTPEEVEAAKSHLFDLVEAEADIVERLAEAQGRVDEFRRLQAALERKHTRVSRTLERAGIDVYELTAEMIGRLDQAIEESGKAADGER